MWNRNSTESTSNRRGKQNYRNYNHQNNSKNVNYDNKYSKYKSPDKNAPNVEDKSSSDRNAPHFEDKYLPSTSLPGKSTSQSSSSNTSGSSSLNVASTSSKSSVCVPASGKHVTSIPNKNTSRSTAKTETIIQHPTTSTSSLNKNSSQHIDKTLPSTSSFHKSSSQPVNRNLPSTSFHKNSSSSNDKNLPSTSSSCKSIPSTVPANKTVKCEPTKEIAKPPENEEKESESIEEIERKEKEQLSNYVADITGKISLKEERRRKNLSITYPEDKVSKGDSSFKKSTAFVRKLRNYTEQQSDTLIKEIVSLNLEKYISEIAAALIEAKFKLSDVPSLIKLCSALHETYCDFSKTLYDHWQKVLSIKKDEKVQNPSKLRVDLRFYSELLVNGILPEKEGFSLLKNILNALTYNDKEEHANASIILSFSKHCVEDYAGIIPKKIRKLSEKYNIEVPRSNIFPADKQTYIKTLLKDYYATMCVHLEKDHNELKELEKQNKKILQTKGELSTEHKEKLEAFNNAFQKLHLAVQNLAEALDDVAPELNENKSQKDTMDDLYSFLGCENENTLTMNLWEHEESQRFYEEFPNVEDFIVHAKPKENVESVQKVGSVDSKKPPSKELADTTEDVATATANATMKTNLDAFCSHLPYCVNKEMIDNAAIEFLMNYNNKGSRRRLSKTLFAVPRTRLDLLPFYSRFVAILNPVMSDVANDLGNLLKNEFKFLLQKKDQINIETKIKVVRFIGELVKFRLFSKAEGLICLKELLQDFTHHHIEMACNFLETAGRFLYHNVDTHPRMRVYLEQIMRKKLVMNLDWRYVNMIENAYYYVNPPEVAPRQTKKKSPLEAFICKILYNDLNMREDVETKVLMLMRKLDWDDKATSQLAVNCLSCAWKVKYFNIRSLANLLAGLVEYQEFVGIEVVDNVIEDIRWGLEVNSIKMNQRRVAMIKYLGELYNYRMIESIDVFKVLYSLVSFGVIFNYNINTPADPPRSTFRLRLICILLETCGQYFNYGTSKSRLDAFFVYFQHYYMFKYSNPAWTREYPFPIAIKHLVQDILLTLRPKVKIMETYEEAKAALDELQRDLLRKLEPLNLIPKPTEAKPSSMGTCNQQLPTISEFGDDSGKELENIQVSKKNVILSDNWETLCVTESGGDYLNNRGDAVFDEIPDDSDFTDAFDKMVSGMIKERLHEQVKTQVSHISVPYNVRHNTKKSYEQLQNPVEEDTTKMNFMLIVRKGNKQHYKNLQVPVDSELAINLISHEKQEQLEMERVKKLTLDINDRLEEEDYQEQVAAYSQKPVNQYGNRDRRHQQKHFSNKTFHDTNDHHAHGRKRKGGK